MKKYFNFWALALIVSLFLIVFGSLSEYDSVYASLHKNDYAYSKFLNFINQNILASDAGGSDTQFFVIELSTLAFGIFSIIKYKEARRYLGILVVILWVIFLGPIFGLVLLCSLGGGGSCFNGIG